MDSRWIGPLLALGWLLLTLGVWGACGQPWWIWALAVGVGLLGFGAFALWAYWRELRKAASKNPEEAR